MEEESDKNLGANLLEVQNGSSKNVEKDKNIFIKYEIADKMNKSYQNNEIRTSKYKYYNFIFKILFEQFSQAANIFFLILGILQVNICFLNNLT